MDFGTAGVGQDGSLNGSSVGNGFVGVYASVGLFSVEEVLEKLDDFGDTGRSSNQNHFVDLVFAELGVFENFLDRGDAVFEHGQTQFLEFGSGDDSVEVHGLGQRVHFDSGLGG